MIKRYLYTYSSDDLHDYDFGELIDTVTFQVLNKLCDIVQEKHPNLVYICSDLGYNKRAQSINSDYKANRKRAKTLTEEEKETSYVEFINNVAKTLPWPFINIKNVEADMIIRCVITFLDRYIIDKNITIVSSDSDFIQLLNKNVSIYDWYKGDVNISNWYIKHKKHDKYMNSKNYAIGKAIAGDPSDNIKGLAGYGWKRVTKLIDLLNTYIMPGSDIVIDNFDNLLQYIEHIITYNSKDLEPKDLNFIIKFNNDIKTNKQSLIDNLDIIDLNMIETPYLYKIYNEIESKTFDKPLSFNRKQLLDYMNLGRYGKDDPEMLKKLIDKNSKSLYIFYTLASKANMSIRQLKNKKDVNV